MYGTDACAYSIFLDTSLKCFVCGANTLATFKPCGHCVLCEVCARRIKRCPTCKVYIYTVFKMCLNSVPLILHYLCAFPMFLLHLETCKELCSSMLDV